MKIHLNTKIKKSTTSKSSLIIDFLGILSYISIIVSLEMIDSELGRVQVQQVQVFNAVRSISISAVVREFIFMFSTWTLDLINIVTP